MVPEVDGVDGTVQVAGEGSALIVNVCRVGVSGRKGAYLLMLLLFCFEPKRPWMKMMGGALPFEPSFALGGSWKS